MYATAPHGRSVIALLPQLHLDRGELVVAAGHGVAHGTLLFRRDIRHRAPHRGWLMGNARGHEGRDRAAVVGPFFQAEDPAAGLLDHPWILRRSSPPDAIGVAILYEKAFVEAVAIAIAVAIAFAIAAGFRPRHGGRGGELIVREKVDLNVLQPLVGVLLGGRRRTAAISEDARAIQDRKGDRCGERHDEDDQQDGDVVRHVKMRHHGEHVGVARQRVDSHSMRLQQPREGGRAVFSFRTSALNQ